MLKLLRNMTKRDGRRPSKERRRRVLGAAALTLSNFLTPVAKANVVGTDLRTFNPTTSGLDFVTVQSSQTLAPGVINLGMFLNYAVNSLPYFDRTKDGLSTYNNGLLGADVNVGVGLLPGWDLGLSAPAVLYQSVKDEGYRGQYGDMGDSELRANSKLHLLGGPTGGVALVGTVGLNRVKNNPFAGENAGPTTSAELVLDKSIHRIALALNLGYRWRNPGQKLAADTPVTPLGSQYIASAAASYLLSRIDTKLIFEVYGSAPAGAEDDASRRLSATAEALLGLKHDFTTHLAGHLGGGSELKHGRGSPDWRVYTGLNYALGPTFAKPEPQHIVPPPPPPARPKLVLAKAPKPKEKLVIHDVLFEYDSSELIVGQGDETLGQLVSYIKQGPGFQKLVIEGHTDSIGSDGYNLRLSQRRADTIKRWLVSRYHLDPARVVAIGRGERFPIADNGNFQGRQLNRRVEFTIYRPTH